MPQPTRDELEVRVARLSRESFTQKHRADSLYDQLRRLENSVRDHAKSNGGDCAELLRLVPKSPRKTLRELRRGKR